MVEHGVRHVVHVLELVDARRPVALAQLLLVPAQDHGQVGELRDLPAQGTVEQDLRQENR